MSPSDSKSPVPGGTGETANPQRHSNDEENAHAAHIQNLSSAPGPLERTPTLARIATAIDSTPIEEVPPPQYSSTYGDVKVTDGGAGTTASIASDGRVNINIQQESQKLSNLLIPALRSHFPLRRQDDSKTKPYIPPGLGAEPGDELPPRMNVVINVVGSRGDVQPFVALGKVLKEQYGHRVRLATHPVFKDFVEENGLEFFTIGGDPAELMAFMVKNPGLMPGFDSMRNGDIGKRRKGMYEIVLGCWRSCYEAGDGFGIEASDENFDAATFDSAAMGDITAKPFIADVIIANPPSFAHIHCSEKLGIPLHMMFTMPWSPTQAFPHPLANIQSSNVDSTVANFMTYALMDMMTWQGLGDVINKFRERKLGLEPISIIWAPGILERHRIPYTYAWSPALIPKPRDWGQHIDVSGFFFLSLASNYTPPDDLAAFLAAGPPPVYIGFGSIVVDDPNAMTKLIFDAVKKTGQRALVSKGWGGFGGDELGLPDGVFMLGNCPHDWLFRHVSCVVHHGGAGTTAAGIALGRPTVVVPFFGDQPFWGSMVARAGAGPNPIPYKELDSDKLAAAIKEALKPEALERAGELGKKILSEKGTENGAECFHKHLDIELLRCFLSPKRTATWRIKRTGIRLSTFAATVLGQEGLLKFDNLKLYRPNELTLEDGPTDPITGGAGALLGTMGSMMMGIADFPPQIMKAMRIANDKKLEKQSSSDDVTPHGTPQLTPQSSASASVRTSEDAPIQPLSTNLSSRSTTSVFSNNSNTEPSTPVTPTISGPTVYDDDKSSRASSNKHQRQSSLATALQSISRSTSRSRPHSRGTSRSGSRTASPARQDSGMSQATQISFEDVVGAGSGLGKVIGAGVRSPMDFTLGLARGFHNAPKLYGDDTVRKQEPVTGFQSGLKAAGRDLGYGLFDGITGLVTQPLIGAKKEGAAGFVKGIGKGIGGVMLKPMAGFWGLPGYTFQGIVKEIQKHIGMSVQNYIVAARTAQGLEEYQNSTPEERAQVIERWHAMQVQIPNLKRERSRGHHRTNSETASTKGSTASVASPSGFAETRHLSFDERKKIAKEKRKVQDEERRQRRKEFFKHLLEPKAEAPPPAVQTRPTFSPTPSSSTTTAPAQPTKPKPISPEFEEAITRSVTATSRGDAQEDKLIERALRASVVALHDSQTSGHTEDESYLRAVAASVAEANRVRTEAQPSKDIKVKRAPDGLLTGTTASVPTAAPEEEEQIPVDDGKGVARAAEAQRQYDEQLAEALRLSLLESSWRTHQGRGRQSKRATGTAADDGGDDSSEVDLADDDIREDTDTEGDEDYRRAVELSKHQEDGSGTGSKDAPVADEDLELALSESKNAHLAHADKLTRQQTEEEIVLEYVKKQSLLEEEAKKKLGGQTGVAADGAEDVAAGGEDEDEELRKAIEESMKVK